MMVFVLSGTAALIYELVWFHLVQLVVGASSFSVAALLASFMGGMALGAWGWGVVADWTSLEAAHLIAGLVLLASLALHWLQPMSAAAPPDLQPLAKTEPLPEVQAGEEGPVLVHVEYEIGPADAPAFVAAMDEVGHLRRRNGALRWRLYQDTADGARWLEAFVLGDWVEHQRLRRRMTRADATLEGRAVAYHRGAAAPRRRYLIARRHDSRYLLDEAEEAELAATRRSATTL